MEFFYSFYQYIIYQCKAKGANSIHSPFVFEFYNEVLAHPYNFYAFEKLENARAELLSDQSIIEYHDLGSSRQFRKGTISSIASQILMPVEKAVVLFQLSHWLKPQGVLELGSAFGITTSYLAKAYPSEIITIEGVEPIANRAKQVWKSLEINTINSLVGKVEDLLPSLLLQPENLPELVVVDANHSYEATMQNYRWLANSLSDSACIVFDDIYWSAEMGRAWKEIKEDPRVTVSIDVFGLGFVFFRKESRKENFVLRW